jgi:hypothetical protein
VGAGGSVGTTGGVGVGGSVGIGSGVGVGTGNVGKGVGTGNTGVGVVVGGRVAPPDGPGVGTAPGGVWEPGPPGDAESLPSAARCLLIASIISGERRGIFSAT